MLGEAPCVVGTANQGTRQDGGDAGGLGLRPELREFFGAVVADDGMVLPGGLELLAQREALDARIGQIVEGLDQFLPHLPESDHETALCRDVRGEFAGLPKDGE